MILEQIKFIFMTSIPVFFSLYLFLTSVVWSGAFVEAREFKADDASESTFGYLVANDRFDVWLLLLLNLNSIQGIAVELLSSSWVVDGEMLSSWKKEKKI